MSSLRESQSLSVPARLQEWCSGVHVPVPAFAHHHAIVGLCRNGFTFYDHVLDMSTVLGNIPAKYATAAKEHQLSPLDVMFAMGRGRQRDGVDVEASESTQCYLTVAFILTTANHPWSCSQ